MSWLKDKFWFITMSGLLGLGLATWAQESNLYDEIRFTAKPIVMMSGRVVSRLQSNVVIHMYGIKLRGVECEFKGIQAFGDRVVGMPIDLSIVRIDAPETNRTKPAGPYDLGHWRVWPVDEVIHVRVYVTHNCQGSHRATLIAEVGL